MKGRRSKARPSADETLSNLDKSDREILFDLESKWSQSPNTRPSHQPEPTASRFSRLPTPELISIVKRQKDNVEAEQELKHRVANRDNRAVRFFVHRYKALVSHALKKETPVVMDGSGLKTLSLPLLEFRQVEIRRRLDGDLSEPERRKWEREHQRVAKEIHLRIEPPGSVLELTARRGDIRKTKENIEAISVQENDSQGIDSRKAQPSDTRTESLIAKLENPLTETLTTLEAARVFRVEKHTIYRWIHKKKLRKGPKRGTITAASVRKLQGKNAKA